MATIMIISESGFPHCAFRINALEWYGFKPSIPKMPVSSGHVDHSDRSAYVASSVTLRVSDNLVQTEVPRIEMLYASQAYVVGVHDCVSFVADVAEALGLVIPPRPNFLPGNFVASMRALNSNNLVG